MQSKNVDVNISKIKKNYRLKSPSSIRVRVFSERCIDNRGHCAISPNSDRVTILKRFFLLDLRVASITVVNGTRLKASVLQVHGRGVRTPCVCVHRANKWPNSLHSRLNAKQPRHRVIALSMQISLRIRRFVSTVRFDSTLSLQRTYELQRYWRTAVSVELSIPFFLFSTLSYRNRY